MNYLAISGSNVCVKVLISGVQNPGISIATPPKEVGLRLCQLHDLNLSLYNIPTVGC